ncbi:hypothetical protein F511_39571 [Dorcoceras hygrometricum]|uniref:Uncharacterized protein n=1 Tax=Dorcoceras hygrometricum TaxID=472368 RepID=A0A2Z7CCF9_9LAMI|nr:hypothetical protein F511_39571 [Dorcoceras hygrometricum]
MQMDSDLVIYRTALVRTFQVVTICRVDKSEVLVVLISPHYSKHRSNQIVDRSYDEVTVIGMNRMFIRWSGPAPGDRPSRLNIDGSVLTRDSKRRHIIGPLLDVSITAIKMVSMKNPLAAILDSNRFTGLNYQDWLRNLNLVLASGKLLYTIEKSPPEETPADISPEELITLNQWRHDEVKARCYVTSFCNRQL